MDIEECPVVCPRDKIRRFIKLYIGPDIFTEGAFGFYIDASIIIKMDDQTSHQTVHLELIDIDPAIYVWDDEPQTQYVVDMRDPDAFDDCWDAVVEHLIYHASRTKMGDGSETLVTSPGCRAAA